LSAAARVPAARTNLLEERIPLSDHSALAHVYDALGSTDSVIAVYERYLRARLLSRMTLDAFELGNALAQLAGLYEQRSDAARAAQYYARLADLWLDADAPVRRRAAFATEYARALAIR